MSPWSSQSGWQPVLDDYLLQLQGEGRLEALGQEFSLDLVGQSRKLSEYQLSRPGLWILKLVQAAVASGAEEVQLRSHRSWLEVRFWPDHSGPLQIGPEAQGWQRHLHWGLLAALASGGGGLQLSWQGEAVFGKGRAGGELGPDLRFRVERPARPFWQFTDPAVAEISKAVVERCALCPIPVLLDQRALNRPFLEQALPAPKAARPAFAESAIKTYVWLAERSWLSQDAGRFALAPPGVRPAFQLELGPHSLQKASIGPEPVSCGHWLDCQWPVFRASLNESASQLLAVRLGYDGPAQFSVLVELMAAQAPEGGLCPVNVAARGSSSGYPALACGRWLGLAAVPEREGQLFYVQDGVLLDPIESGSFHPGTCAVIADSSVRTDLSQFTPVVDATVESDRGWLVSEEFRLWESAQSLVTSLAEAERRRLPLCLREHWRARL